MPFVTDRAALKLPMLKGLEPDARAQVLADAEKIYQYIRRNEWIDEPRLRAYGERAGLPPDRLNPALELLQATGRLLHIPEEH